MVKAISGRAMVEAPSSRRVLVISYYYPPFNSVGAVRVSKFTKYLPEFGWQPMVLTVDRDDLPANLDLELDSASVFRSGQIDVNSLPKWFLGKSQIAQSGYTPAGGLLRSRLAVLAGRAYKQLFNFPDGQVGWYPLAARLGRRLVGERRPDVIYSSSLPATSHLVAWRLARETGLPWVADLRDPWTDNQNFRRAQPLLGLERVLESKVLGRASALVTVSEPWAETLRRRFGQLVYVIPNGFDASDCPNGVSPLPFFTLTYTGMIYAAKQDVNPLLQALQRLRDSGALPDGFRARFIGRYLNHVALEANSKGLADHVQVMAPVSRRAALQLQAESTALLLLVSGRDPQDQGWCPAKLFEYLGIKRPILAIGPQNGVAAQLVQRLRAGVVVQDSTQVERTLLEWLAEFRATGRVAVHSDDSELAAYDRRFLTGELARVLDRVCVRRESSPQRK